MAALHYFLVLSVCASAVSSVSFSFLENETPGRSFGILVSGGQDFQFSVNSDDQCNEYFRVVPETGEIQTIKSIDREKVVSTGNSDTIQCSLSYDPNNGNPSQQLSVSFMILDENDENPMFFGLDHPIHVLNIYENIPVDQPIVYLMPIDYDNGENGTVQFEILSGNEGNYFDLVLPVGENSDVPDRLIALKSNLDHESNPMFNFTIRLQDMGSPPLQTIQYIVINIQDINDEVPLFTTSSFSFEVPENHSVGKLHPFGVINATDFDSGVHSQIFYQLDHSGSIDDVSDFVAVNTTTGELYLLRSLNFDKILQHTFYFRIEARNPGSPSGTNADITLVVTDVNDEVPYIVEDGLHQSVEENLASQLIRVLYKDDDIAENDHSIGEINVTFHPPVTHLKPNLIETEAAITLITVNITERLDHEQDPVIIMTVTLTDKGTPSLTSHTNVTITVTDVNDNPPLFSQSLYNGRISALSQPRRLITAVQATDADIGDNGRVTYSLEEAKPFFVMPWFEIDSDNGDIWLAVKPNYTLATVNLTVFAQDHGITSMNSTATVVISIIPPISFQPLSFQLYRGIDLISATVFYLEFLTDKTNASLLYQYNQDTDTYAKLEVHNGKVEFYNGAIYKNSRIIGANVWYSVMFNSSNSDELMVWSEEEEIVGQAIEILRTAAILESPPPTGNTLQVGGVKDAFSIPSTHLLSYDFTGSIGTVVVQGTQLDLEHPLEERNTISGEHIQSCSAECNVLSECVSYTNQSDGQCRCLGGFQSCEEDDYEPISLTGGSYIEFKLGYDYFYNEAYVIPNSQNSETDGSILQTIKLVFTPETADLNSIILYSQTEESIQKLEIRETLRYTVADKNHRTTLSLVTEELILIPGANYTIEIQLRNDGGNIIVYTNSVNQNLQVFPNVLDEDTLSSFMFAKEPSTEISLGGTYDPMFSVEGIFSGCIRSLSIDGSQLPLSGIVKHNDLHLTVRGSSDDVASFCHACMEAICPAGSTCVVEGQLSSGQYSCQCPRGYTLRDRQCIVDHYNSSSLTPSPTSLLTPSRSPLSQDIIENTSSKLKLGFIIGIAIGALVLIFLTFLVLGLAFRCAYVRGKKNRGPQFVTKVTYHNGDCRHDDSKSNGHISINNSKVAPIRVSNPYVLTNLKRSRRSSSSDADSTDGMPSPVRKSMSQETGFHTASEPASRISTPRRLVSDSGRDSSVNDSDYSHFETDSEEVTTSGIEDAITPNDLKLVSSTGSMISGYRNKYSDPLSPKEIRQNSTLLMSEDETDTEVSTTTSHIRRDYSDNDSIMSNPTSPKWYKNSSPSTAAVDSDTSCTTPTEDEPRKHNRHRRKHDSSLPHLKHHKGSAPKVYSSHLSNSPLANKSYRYDYPPPPHNHYGEPVEPHNLPAIEEASAYPHPYHHMLYHQDPRMMEPHGHVPIYPSYPPPPHMPRPPQGPPPNMPYYSGYQGTSLTPGDTAMPQYPDQYRGQYQDQYRDQYRDQYQDQYQEQYRDQYHDLNSLSKMNNPISYWEQQTRLRPAVDQEDEALCFLNEPYKQFDDVSTTPSVVESSIMGDGESDYVMMAAGIRRPNTSRALHQEYSIKLNHGVGDSVESIPINPRSSSSEQSGKPHPFYDLGSQPPDVFPTGGITHFPSADCTPTLLSPSDLEHVESGKTVTSEQ